MWAEYGLDGSWACLGKVGGGVVRCGLTALESPLPQPSLRTLVYLWLLGLEEADLSLGWVSAPFCLTWSVRHNLLVLGIYMSVPMAWVGGMWRGPVVAVGSPVCTALHCTVGPEDWGAVAGFCMLVLLCDALWTHSCIVIGRSGVLFKNFLN